FTSVLTLSLTLALTFAIANAQTAVINNTNDTKNDDELK
ncbi:MAG: hypothetical protein ACI94Z_000072, partial [Yoonia sp.]